MVARAREKEKEKTIKRNQS